MRLVIFDMDGTLIDSVSHFVETVTLAFTAVDQAVPDEKAIRSISGITARDAMALLAPGSSEARVDAILKSYREHYFARTGIVSEPLFAGALEALDRLGAHPETILAVATGKSHKSAVKLLKAHGIFERFHSVQTPDHNFGKPHPQMIESAMARALAEPGSTVMIGDTVHDMRMGRAAGVKSIGVDWGYHTVDELVAEGADVILDSFEGLDAALDGLVPHA